MTKTSFLFAVLLLSASGFFLFPDMAAAKCAPSTGGTDDGCSDDGGGTVSVPGHYQCLSCGDGYYAGTQTSSNGQIYATCIQQPTTPPGGGGCPGGMTKKVIDGGAPAPCDAQE